MNNYQLSLYNDLITLSNADNAFYFVDQSIGNSVFRIFNYRLATYSHFLEPNALESRGIMFEVDADGSFIRLAAHPQHKFFNLNENPFTTDLNLSQDNIKRVELKEDGSLISTFIYKDGGHYELGIKSKGSLHSDQCRMVYNFIDVNKAFADELRALTIEGYTVNMELTSPDNRIVLNYVKTNLVVLNVRCIKTGQYLSVTEIDCNEYPLITKHWVSEAWCLGYDVNEKTIDSAFDIEGIEGFIVYLNDGTVFKLKTTWYVTQHRAKDNVDSPRRLFEAAIHDTTDDLRSLFTDNPSVLNQISEMETFAASIYNNVVDTVTKFVSKHQDLIDSGDRKQFAILGQNELQDKRLFGLVMQCFTGNEPDYKAFCLKHWREWGLTDKETSE